MTFPTRCSYIRATNDIGELARQAELFSRDIFDRVLRQLDGLNMADGLLDGDTLAWQRQQGGGRRIYAPTLSPTGVPALRRKGIGGKFYGLEMYLDLSNTAHGRFCLVSGADPSKTQRLSLYIDEHTVGSPGGYISTPTGALTVEAFADWILKRNNVEGLRQDGTGLLASKQIRFNSEAFHQIKGDNVELHLEATSFEWHDPSDGLIMRLDPDDGLSVEEGTIRFDPAGLGRYGRLTHLNTAERTYTFPDATGDVLLNPSGSPLSDNVLPKVGGGGQLVDSGVTDDGAILDINRSVDISDDVTARSAVDILGSVTAANIVTAATASGIPKAGSTGKLDKGWIPKPKGHFDGGRLRYSSATAVIVEALQCRNAADDGDLTLAESTLPITTDAAFPSTHGLDVRTLSETASINGTTSITISASLLTALSTWTHSMTGTITSSGTAVTGSSSKFLSELAPGDTLKSASNGAARVASITSDTACVLEAAFPGGNIGAGQACSRIENLTIWPGATAANKTKVNTISANGLTVVAPGAMTGTASGLTLKVGVEVASAWYFPTVVTNGTDTIGVLSTQRTTPFLAGVTGKRRIPAEQFNDGSGNLRDIRSVGTGRRRKNYWTDLYTGSPANRILSGGAATSFTPISAHEAVPPTADLMFMNVFLLDFKNIAGNNGVSWRVTGTTPANRFVSLGGYGEGSTTENSLNGNMDIPVGSAGAVDYRIEVALTAGAAYVDVCAWESES